MIIYIHTLPLKSLHLLSLYFQFLHLQTLRLVFSSQFDYLNIKNISHNGRQKSGTKSTGVLLFLPLRRPALLPSAGYCEKRPDCIT